MRAVVASSFAVLAFIACGSSSDDSSNEPDCVPRDGVYACRDSSSTLPFCQADAQNGAKCDPSSTYASCMGCWSGRAGYTCGCRDAPSGVDAGVTGPVWQCTGTGYTCR